MTYKAGRTTVSCGRLHAVGPGTHRLAFQPSRGSVGSGRGRQRNANPRSDQKLRPSMTPGSGFKVARIFGIPIYLHSTWVVIFALSTFSLGNLFTQNYPHWTKAQQWGVGLLTSLLFFGSVLFHELSHSVVAQHYEIRVVSITLFIFGGLARIARDPSKAIQEFNIAVAGPLASFFLFGVFAVLEKSFPHNEMLAALAGWLAFINFRLALFNLIPGFPLDGGRIFRAIVWGVTKDHSRATRVAGTSGKLVAYGLMAA